MVGAHVIMLGPGNEAAAHEALASWPGGLQIGGGITADNANKWMERGAEKVRHHECDEIMGLTIASSRSLLHRISSLKLVSRKIA